LKASLRNNTQLPSEGTRRDLPIELDADKNT
jgi:hypothetical protein